jgi:glycerate kinase
LAKGLAPTFCEFAATTIHALPFPLDDLKIAVPLRCQVRMATRSVATRVLVCCDNFKGTAAAAVVGASIRAALQDGGAGDGLSFDVAECPMSDGGAGFLSAMLAADPGLRSVTADVVGPLGAPVAARYALHDAKGYAVVEMAAASGIELVPRDRLDPYATTSFGTGQLLQHAAAAGVAEIFLGVGGSATNDAALGMLQCLGFDIELECVGGGRTKVGANDPPLTGGDLLRVAALGGARSLAQCFPGQSALRRVVVVCDATNPFTGPAGATRVYGPQKGAAPAQLDALEAAMSRVEAMVFDATSVRLDAVAGAGAAGGMGGTAHALLGASIVGGAAAFAERVGLRERVRGADVVITGEGCYDGQTVEFGKTCALVQAVCREEGRPLVVMCGVHKAAETAGHAAPAAVLPLVPTFSVDDAMGNTAACVGQLAARNRQLLHDIAGAPPTA